jgi:hypothetical protein
MTAHNVVQKLRFHNFGVDSLNDTAIDTGTVGQGEFDSAGYESAVVLCSLGAVGAANFDAFSVHASDTAGFSPGAGNILADALTPLQTDDTGIYGFIITDLTAVGRYINVIGDPGAAASDFAITLIAYPKDVGPTTAAERGLVANTVI